MKPTQVAFLLLAIAASVVVAHCAENAAAKNLSETTRTFAKLKLTSEQQQQFDALASEYRSKFQEAQKKIAAGDWPAWRAEAASSLFWLKTEALLTAEQKQARALEKLKEPTTMEFVETPLCDVVDYFADVHKTRIALDQSAMRHAGLDKCVPITINLKGLSLDSGLRLMLREIGCAHVVVDGTILITTEAEIRQLVTHGAIDPAAVPGMKPMGWQKRIEQAFREPITAEIHAKSIDGLISDFQDLAKVSIYRDTSDLKDAGLDPDDSPYDFKFKNMPLGDAMKQAFAKYGLAYELRDEVIFVTTSPERRRNGEGQVIRRLNRLGAVVSVEKDGAAEIVLDQAASARAFLDEAARFNRLASLDCRSLLSGKPLTSNDLARLRSLRGLVSMSLHGDPVTDQATEIIGELSKLESLDLSQTDITGAGLKNLESLAELTSLDLGETEITRFPRLKGLSKLKCLNLHGTKIGDDDMRNFTVFSKLEALDLSKTRIRGTTLNDLAELKGLNSLSLKDSAIDDAALARLAGLTSLTSLDLSGTKITDAGIERLAQLKVLSNLDLGATAVTDKGVAALKLLPRLYTLQIGGAKVSNEALKVLYAEMKKHPRPTGTSDDPFGAGGPTINLSSDEPFLTKQGEDRFAVKPRSKPEAKNKSEDPFGR